MPAALGFIGGMFSFGATVSVLGARAVAGAWAGAGFASTILGSITVKLLTTVAFTALSQAMASEPAQGGGVTIPATLRGEENPETIILGRYATGGQAICPPYTHGKDGRYMTQIIELCSAPGATLERFMLGDKWRELTDDWVPRSDQNKEFFGKMVVGQEENLTWVKYYDGTQTVADPYLREKYGNHPDRPWTSDMVGHGICYAILTFRHDREHQAAVPRYRFEMGGIPLYDIRRDSTAGGVGPQRLADPSTWAPSHNPIVQGWNVMRGIPLPGGEVYGGDFRDLRALPQASWVNAMNRADIAVETDDGSEAAYRAGLEISLAQPPASALEELFKAASATVADQGYGWTVTVGAPELPVYAFSDDDIIVSQPQELDPFPGLEQTYNAVTGRYPEPEELWETKEAPQRTNAEWEASDAFGRRSAALSLPSVPYGNQVQRLMRAWVEEERRFRRHVINLLPDAAHLELTDVIDWSSGRNGYTAKDFGIFEIAEDPRTGIRKLSIRERDAADYDWQPGFILPSPPSPTITTSPAPVAIDGWGVAAITLQDAEGRDRRPAIRLVWDGETIGDSLIWELRLTGQTDPILDGEVRTLNRGRTVISAGILPATGYEARGRVISSRRPTIWTDWTSVVTENVGLSPEDIPASVLQDLADIEQGFVDVAAQIDALSQETTIAIQGARDTASDALINAVAAVRADVPDIVQTGITEHDVVVQGREAALAGRLEEIAAALTSETLVINGSFADAMSAWTASNAMVLAQAGSSDALVLAAPAPNVAAIGTGATGNIQQGVMTFEADPNDDKMQVRFWAASTVASRTVRVGMAWQNGAGNAVTPASTVDVTVNGANQWKSYAVKLDIPAGATSGAITITKTQSGTRVLLTKIAVEVVNIAIEARVSSLETVSATTKAALAAYIDSATTRFGNTDGAITQQGVTLSGELGALSDRLDLVRGRVATNEGKIATQGTTIVDHTQVLTSLTRTVTSTFGSVQQISDPIFDYEAEFWRGALSNNPLWQNRDKTSVFWPARDMPSDARRALRFFNSSVGGGTLQSLEFAVAPSEKYDLSYYYGRTSGGPSIRAAIIWMDNSGEVVGSGPLLNADKIHGRWHMYAHEPVAPPDGATKARINLGVYIDGGTSNANGYLTGVYVKRLAAYDQISLAKITETSTALADSDRSFTEYVGRNDSRLDDIDGPDGKIAAQASAIDRRATIASVAQSLSSIENTTNAKMGRMSANGAMRVYSTATPTDALSRIGLSVDASAGEEVSAAAVYLEAKSDGANQVIIDARRFALVQSATPDATKMVPFYVQGGNVYLANPLIAPNAISRMVNVNRQTLVDPGPGLGKWAYQYPPNAAPPGQPNPAETRNTYSDYISATISASLTYDLYFWISFSGGDSVGNIFRNDSSQPYGGFVHRTVLDSHTWYSYNSGSIVGVIPQVTGTQRVTLSVAGIHGSEWTAAINASITLMALQK